MMTTQESCIRLFTSHMLWSSRLRQSYRHIGWQTHGVIVRVPTYRVVPLAQQEVETGGSAFQNCRATVTMVWSSEMESVVVPPEGHCGGAAPFKIWNGDRSDMRRFQSFLGPTRCDRGFNDEYTMQSAISTMFIGHVGLTNEHNIKIMKIQPILCEFQKLYGIWLWLF